MNNHLLQNALLSGVLTCIAGSAMAANSQIILVNWTSDKRVYLSMSDPSGATPYHDTAWCNVQQNCKGETYNCYYTSGGQDLTYYTGTTLKKGDTATVAEWDPVGPAGIRCEGSQNAYRSSHITSDLPPPTLNAGFYVCNPNECDKHVLFRTWARNNGSDNVGGDFDSCWARLQKTPTKMTIWLKNDNKGDYFNGVVCEDAT